MDEESKAIPAADDLFRRAEDLVPVLKQRAARCAAEKRIPEETIRSLHALGLFKVIKPPAYGGYQLGWDVFDEIVMTLASGCGSTGWVYSVVGQHPFIMNRFGIDAMDEIWRDNEDALMASSK
jgi:3-hydroxy-9,10-secoandrosta-1,3,5(10)-triene-9,17-dione monooxygenase